MSWQLRKEQPVPVHVGGQIRTMTFYWNYLCPEQDQIRSVWILRLQACGWSTCNLNPWSWIMIRLLGILIYSLTDHLFKSINPLSSWLLFLFFDYLPTVTQDGWQIKSPEKHLHFLFILHEKFLFCDQFLLVSKHNYIRLGLKVWQTTKKVNECNHKHPCIKQNKTDKQTTTLEIKQINYIKYFITVIA